MKFSSMPVRSRLLIIAAGAACAVAALVLLVISLIKGPEEAAGNFRQALAAWDSFEAEEGRPALLAERLLEVEGQAKTVEDWLSVLKRRRRLAGADLGQVPAYRQSARLALAVYPHSAALALCAADALLAGGLPESAREELHGIAAALSPDDDGFAVLVLSILAGDCASPQKAFAVPGLERLLSNIPVSGQEEADLNLDGVLLKLLAGNASGALAQLDVLLRSGVVLDNEDKLMRAAAELHYDFGDPVQAAALISRFTDPQALARQADALYLSGNIEGARGFWSLLSRPAEEPGIREAALYNLAVTGSSAGSGAGSVADETRASLEALHQLNPANLPGAVLYSRCLPGQEALALLEGLTAHPPPLLDLEIVRRRGEITGPLMASPEVWLLIGRHPDEAKLYEWGAWYFERQRQHEELRRLLKNCELNGIDTPRLAWYRLMAPVLDGRADAGALEQAAEGLAVLEQTRNPEIQGFSWRIKAAQAVILQSLRRPREALTLFEKALQLAGTAPESARLALDLAKVYLTLNSLDKARETLALAAELDPGSLAVRHEIRRLREQYGY